MAKFPFGKPKPSKHKIKKSDLSKVTDIKSVSVGEDGYHYLNITEAPFLLGGIIDPSRNCGEYYRLDAAKKDVYSAANRSLAECTSGGTVRFSTDAEEISLHIDLRGACVGMHHFCDRGVFGVDTYVGTGSDRAYVGAAMQFFAESPEHNEGVLKLPSGIKELTVNLPLYSGIKKIEIGFPKSAHIGAPSPRSCAPVAFYGSSITQGGCVSRPSNAYFNILARALDFDCCNYGFSGSAMGELPVAEHIASRELGCFVMDYDYNSPSAETLAQTHEPFFKLIREKQPALPVVFVTHPFYAKKTKEDEARFEVVRKTYENAKKSDDKNVYFVDSSAFFTPEMRDLYSVDFLHPNDLGHFKMAEAIYPTLAKILKK